SLHGRGRRHGADLVQSEQDLERRGDPWIVIDDEYGSHCRAILPYLPPRTGALHALRVAMAGGIEAARQAGQSAANCPRAMSATAPPARYPADHPDEGDQQILAEEVPDDPATRRAQRPPNPDLSLALRHPVARQPDYAGCRHPEEARGDDGEKERETAIVTVGPLTLL